jgi:hypothetical protein
MRIAYLDEAGISNIRQEPYLVIAGILIHGDRDWPKLHRHLEKLAHRYDVPSHFGFHAKDIFHGSGLFDRNNAKWPLVRRRKLLLELASIPKKFKLPVVVGFIQRRSFNAAFEDHVKAIKRILPDAMRKASPEDLAYLEAFVGAARGVDYWLMEHSKTEQGLIILEDSSRTKGDLKFLQAIFRDSSDIHMSFLHARKFKSKRIIETVHFAGKRDSPMLQIADICAFTIKRQLMRRPDIAEFYRVIEPQIVRTKRTSTDNDLDFAEMKRAWIYRSSD